MKEDTVQKKGIEINKKAKAKSMVKRSLAIVGRPNVGKSTLFNRLIGRKTAIVDNQSGVTRDRIQGEAEWEGKTFSVTDTGGYVPKPNGIFEAEIREQVEKAIEEASAVLFMVDVRTGITEEDEAFAHLLLRLNKPVLVIANKADNQHYGFYSYEFYQLGFGKIFPLSSTNGSGTTELLDEVYNLLNLDQVPLTENEQEEVPAFAILGRPNTGKSTLINALIGENRHIVSDIPGTTRDSLASHFNKFDKAFEVVDTAGLRKEKRVDDKNLEQVANTKAIQAMEQADVCFLMLDAHYGLEKQDINLINLVRSRKKGLVILVNKWDDVEKDDKTHLDYIDHIKNRINMPMDVPIYFISALEKLRLMKAMDEGLTVYKNMRRTFSTSQLNDVMLNAIEKNPPPSENGHLIHIKYITQLNTKGQAFAFFCNRPENIQSAYKKFLERQLRNNFNLKGIPISLVFKEK